MRFDYKKFAQSRVLVGIAFLVVGILIIFLLSLQNKGAIKPEPDEEDIARNIALIYNSEELYKLLDDNETTISLIRKDLRFFALTTSKNVADDPVVGFTFTKGPTQEGDSYVFEGLFYDIDGKIRLVLNKLKTGVVRLSITNMKTQTNIDEFLQLNGPRNRLIASLPVEKTNYSIRHLFATDRIVLSFYEGFNRAEVDEAYKYIKDFYGTTEYNSDDIVFNVNGVGTFGIDKVYEMAK